MIFCAERLTAEEIRNLKEQFGPYVKVTADIDKGWVVIGGGLHADGEKLLLDKGSRQDNIWGGGVDLENKLVDTTAVLNLRPKLGNESLEIIDISRREAFINLIKNFFSALWS